jgi:hypothetical protein
VRRAGLPQESRRGKPRRQIRGRNSAAAESAFVLRRLRSAWVAAPRNAAAAAAAAGNSM